MLNTVVQMDRVTILLPDGSSVYQITVAVTDKGELPHPNIFVYQIYDTLDTTRDTFVRVATPYDIENINTLRTGAIAAGQSYFLASSMYRRCSDLNKAVQAKDAVRSRIDNSVNAWYTYKTAFEGTESINHPTAEASFEQQLQDDYVAARDERVEAEEALLDADEALTESQDDAADAVALGTKYKNAYDFTSQAYAIYWRTYYDGLGKTNGGAPYPGILGEYVEQLDALKVTYNNITGQAFTTGTPTIPYAYPPAAGTWDTYCLALLTELQNLHAALLAFRNVESNGVSLDNVFGNFHTQVGGEYTAQQGVIATANVAVSNAVTAKKEAEASLASAQAAEDAALAAVRAVCPDFDPSSV